MRVRIQPNAAVAPLVAAIGFMVAGCDPDPISDPHNDPAPIVEEGEESQNASRQAPPQAPSAPATSQEAGSAVVGRPPAAPSNLTVTQSDP